MIRLFIALDVPEINDNNEPIQFTNMQLLIDQAIPGFRPSKTFHTTLVFIGPVQDTMIPTIKIAVERAISVFVNEQKRGIANGLPGLMIKQGARVMGKNAIAMALTDNYLLTTLVAALHKSLEEYHVLHEKQNEPKDFHITLGRIAHDHNHNDIERFLEMLPAPIGSREQLQETFSAPTVTLYESLPHSEYISLARYKI